MVDLLGPGGKKLLKEQKVLKRKAPKVAANAQRNTLRSARFSKWLGWSLSIVPPISFLVCAMQTHTVRAASPDIMRPHLRTDLTEALQTNDFESYRARAKFELTPPKLAPAGVIFRDNGEFALSLDTLPSAQSLYNDKVAGLSARNEILVYSIDPALQARAQQLIESVSAPHAALVAMNPSTGAILAIAHKSPTIDNPVTPPPPTMDFEPFGLALLGRFKYITMEWRMHLKFCIRLISGDLAIENCQFK